MRLFFPLQPTSLLGPDSLFGRWTIGRFQAFLGAGGLLCILGFSFALIYQIVTSSLSEAFARNAQLRAMAQANAISRLLDDAYLELEYLAQRPLSEAGVMAHFNAMPAEKRNRYGEVAFQGRTSGEYFVLVNVANTFVSLPAGQVHGNNGGIFSSIGSGSKAKEGEVRVGEPVEAAYVALPAPGGARSVAMHVIRLSMPVLGPDQQYQGQLVLSVNLQDMRNILSLYTSDQSPLFLLPQNNLHKKSFMFDLAGWLLFESANVEEPGMPLAVDRLRAGLRGDVGRPGFQEAFRPASDYHLYWTLVADVQAGHAGKMLSSEVFGKPDSNKQEFFLNYAPIIFHGHERTEKIVGGIGCFDSSSVLAAVKGKIVVHLFLIFLGIFFVLVFVLYLMGRRISKIIGKMAGELENKIHSDDSTPFAPASPYAELNRFQKSINILLLQLYMIRREIRRRDTTDADERMREKVNLDKVIAKDPALNPVMAASPLHGLVGAGPAIAELRQQLRKAAGVLADVLIIGETGTGKELTASAVHAMSYRAKGPFISISCGALDENLLMDALFGHVPGAFSEAHGERKGAFLAASGGTLLLDEIGNASPKVQQALLRALSVRRIVPLGSDREIAYDARVIAATNVDLLQTAISGQGFRDDLYYRLAVITINTPPLRRRKEDLPVLIRHFLEKNCQERGQPLIAVSRGALEKMLAYDWPGNVRELENCLIRSLTFVEGDVLLAQHILFNEAMPENPDNASLQARRASGELISRRRPAEEEATVAAQEGEAIALNERQQAVWHLIMRQGSISRSEYQEALDTQISVRTAQYDLYDLVERGLLVKSGAGPSCRYTTVTAAD